MLCMLIKTMLFFVSEHSLTFSRSYWQNSDKPFLLWIVLNYIKILNPTYEYMASLVSFISFTDFILFLFFNYFIRICLIGKSLLLGDASLAKILHYISVGYMGKTSVISLSHRDSNSSSEKLLLQVIQSTSYTSLFKWSSVPPPPFNPF